MYVLSRIRGIMEKYLTSNLVMESSLIKKSDFLKELQVFLMVKIKYRQSLIINVENLKIT